MNQQKTYPGKCFCGAVEFTVSGDPLVMGYCHCDSCRHWSAGPVNAFTLWKPENVKVTKGANNIGTFNLVPVHLRAAHGTDGFSAGQSILMQRHVPSRSGAIGRYADDLVQTKIDAYGCDERVRRQQS